MPELSLSALTLFDYAVILVLIISAILSTLRGMTREFLGLTGWFVSIFIARLTASSMEIGYLISLLLTASPRCCPGLCPLQVQQSSGLSLLL